MKALGLGLALAITTLQPVHAQRAAESLPAGTVDCYQSYAAKTQLPEGSDKAVAIDNDNFETAQVRYRLQVVDKTILKIIKDPNQPAFRNEHGKSIWEIKRDFSDKHQIVSWREEMRGGIVRLYAFDFADLLLSTVDISPAGSLAAGVELHVLKCTR